MKDLMNSAATAAGKGFVGIVSPIAGAAWTMELKSWIPIVLGGVVSIFMTISLGYDIAKKARDWKRGTETK